MNNINKFITSVNSSRKRTGLVYCSESFNPIISQIDSMIPELCFLDCANLYNGSVTFSAKELLDKIEYVTKDKTTIVFNIETFIVSNSSGFLNQIAKLLTSREPLKPIFFFFYSKKIFCRFKDEYEAKELNQNNTIEL